MFLLYLMLASHFGRLFFLLLSWQINSDKRPKLTWTSAKWIKILHLNGQRMMPLPPPPSPQAAKKQVVGPFDWRALKVIKLLLLLLFLLVVVVVVVEVKLSQIFFCFLFGASWCAALYVNRSQLVLVSRQKSWKRRETKNEKNVLFIYFLFLFLFFFFFPLKTALF